MEEAGGKVNVAGNGQAALEAVTSAQSQGRPYDLIESRPLYRADRLLDQLRILLRLARDVHLVTERQYAFAAGQNDELGNMIGGWLRSARDERGGGSRSHVPAPS